MKKIIALIIVISFCILASACSGGNTNENTQSETITETVETVTEQSETVTTAEETTEELTTEETTTEPVEYTGEMTGVWRLEKAMVGKLISSSEQPVVYDLSEEMISISISGTTISMGRTSYIKEQYSYLGHISVETDESGFQHATITLFSNVNGRSLKATYLTEFTTDKWGTRKMSLILQELEGDATNFGFESFMNQEHMLEMAEWSYAEADAEHDPALFRSSDAVWYTDQTYSAGFKKLRFSYDEGFVVYESNLIIGTWRTITRNDEKILIITESNGYIREGTYFAGRDNLTIKWDDEDEAVRYFIPMLDY